MPSRTNGHFGHALPAFYIRTQSVQTKKNTRERNPLPLYPFRYSGSAKLKTRRFSFPSELLGRSLTALPYPFRAKHSGCIHVQGIHCRCIHHQHFTYITTRNSGNPLRAITRGFLPSSNCLPLPPDHFAAPPPFVLGLVLRE